MRRARMNNVCMRFEYHELLWALYNTQVKWLLKVGNDSKEISTHCLVLEFCCWKNFRCACSYKQKALFREALCARRKFKLQGNVY